MKVDQKELIDEFGDNLKLNYDLKKSYQVPKAAKAPSAKDLLSEDDFNIDMFLDEQISVNAKINDTLKSTLQRFDNTFGKQKKLKQN